MSHNAPSIDNRLNAMKTLAEKGIDVELRIDPLFPSTRISRELQGHDELSHYCIPEAQTQDDIDATCPLCQRIRSKSSDCKTFKSSNLEKSPTDVKSGSGHFTRMPADHKKGLLMEEAGDCLFHIRKLLFRQSGKFVPNKILNSGIANMT